jgi:ubiquitin-conjugating enzyme E2 Z
MSSYGSDEDDVGSEEGADGGGNDLLSSIGWEKQTQVSPSTVMRIRRDLQEFFSDPDPDIFMAPDEEDVTILHTIIVGPKGTPYEGGFYYFVVQFLYNYPNEPPKVKLMTTGNGKVSLNPNLYECGRVCLSILGTWDGPSWSPVLNTRSLLLSIQSLMTPDPYFNEPSYSDLTEDPEHVHRALKYKEFATHENLRVAVLDMIQPLNTDTRFMPSVLRGVVRDLFVQKVTFYEEKALEFRGLNGQSRQGPWGGSVGYFDFDAITSRLQEEKEKLASKSEDQGLVAYKGLIAYEAMTRGYLNKALVGPSTSRSGLNIPQPPVDNFTCEDTSSDEEPEEYDDEEELEDLEDVEEVEEVAEDSDHEEGEVVDADDDQVGDADHKRDHGEDVDLVSIQSD